MDTYLGRIVDVLIDRKLGSKHPKYNFIYTLNYGYIPGILIKNK
jgi:inorganic pyrophosphatase